MSSPAELAVEPRPLQWLLLVYRIPSEPTRLRAGVWRKIKGLGAIYVQNSAAALPASSAGERSFRALRAEIIELGGTAHVFSSTALAGQSQLVELFNAARDDEYEELVERCNDFLPQVRNEYDTSHFTYAELEENDVDLVKLKGWLEKVRAQRQSLARRDSKRQRRRWNGASSHSRTMRRASMPRKARSPRALKRCSREMFSDKCPCC